VRFGRPPALDTHQQQEAIQRLAAGETQADLARSYGVGVATTLRLRDAGMIKSSPNKILADGTDWRFWNELKRELKS
jgi:hypothetical protein